MNLKPRTEAEAAKIPETVAKPGGVRYPSPFLTTSEAAEYLHVSKAYLQNLRTTGEGPVYLRASARRVLYSVESLDAWMLANTHQSTAEYPCYQAKNVRAEGSRRGRSAARPSSGSLS